MNFRFLYVIAFCSMVFSLGNINGLQAQNKKSDDESQQGGFVSLSPEDKRKFDALSTKQQKLIKKGKIKPGFNAWMVEMAMGQPYFKTEHHPYYKDFEEVWLYTKKEIDVDIKETKIQDPQTNWPMIHRKTTRNVCTVGEKFVLWDRGVVDKLVKAPSRQIYGPCHTENIEEFLPIVDGKVIEASEK